MWSVWVNKIYEKKEIRGQIYLKKKIKRRNKRRILCGEIQKLLKRACACACAPTKFHTHSHDRRNAAVSNVCLFSIWHPKVVSQLIILLLHFVAATRKETGSSDVKLVWEKRWCGQRIDTRNTKPFFISAEQNGTKYNCRIWKQTIQFVWTPCNRSVSDVLLHEIASSNKFIVNWKNISATHTHRIVINAEKTEFHTRKATNSNV